MTVTDTTEPVAHQQVATFVRDERWHMRCSCDWVSPGCMSARKAAMRWNVHHAEAAIEAARERRS